MSSSAEGIDMDAEQELSCLILDWAIEMRVNVSFNADLPRQSPNEYAYDNHLYLSLNPNLAQQKLCK